MIDKLSEHFSALDTDSDWPAKYGPWIPLRLAEGWQERPEWPSRWRHVKTEGRIDVQANAVWIGPEPRPLPVRLFLMPAGYRTMDYNVVVLEEPGPFVREYTIDGEGWYTLVSERELTAREAERIRT